MEEFVAGKEELSHWEKDRLYERLIGLLADAMIQMGFEIAHFQQKSMERFVLQAHESLPFRLVETVRRAGYETDAAELREFARNW